VTARDAMTGAGRHVRRGLAWLVLGPLWVYRHLVSPMLPQTCRYYPSCSAYAEEAVKTHGAVRGSWLAVKRLARCHPWTPGGVDHVPPARPARQKRDASASPVTGV
jgi:putative membrane protein insertion efficiency factor